GGRPPVRHDLRPGAPDISAFPRRDWLTATRTVLASAEHAVFGYTGGLGQPALRTELAGYLGRARGVLTEPGRLMVCGGFGHGLALLCAVLRDRGIDTLAVEDPCLPGYPAAARAAGLRTVPVPVDEYGLRVDVLAGTGARAVLTTPAHQYPTGVALAPERRTALVDWAVRRDGFVIEDD
ncbi:MAG: aminotransferase class I/II-fold pyridoxal phosphate-dependent enzyme, partial [Actinocatenispora sp.]